jgi:hypothetical protein
MCMQPSHPRGGGHGEWRHVVDDMVQSDDSEWGKEHNSSIMKNSFIIDQCIVCFNINKK